MYLLLRAYSFTGVSPIFLLFSFVSRALRTKTQFFSALSAIFSPFITTFAVRMFIHSTSKAKL